MAQAATRQSYGSTQVEVESEKMLVKAPVEVKRGDEFLFFPANEKGWRGNSPTLVHRRLNFEAEFSGTKCTVERIWVCEEPTFKIVTLDVKLHDGRIWENCPTECLQVIESEKTTP